MKKVLLLILIAGSVKAEECTPELKFGTRVKIVNSNYSDRSDLTFIKGLTGHVVNMYTSEYKTNCKYNKVVSVSVCVASHMQCREFALCENDIETIK